jgi:hypothetical protein
MDSMTNFGISGASDRREDKKRRSCELRIFTCRNGDQAPKHGLTRDDAAELRRSS